MWKLTSAVLVTLAIGGISSSSLPGPLVYVVTGAPRAATDAGRQFYYHDWMRRMDAPGNATSATSATSTTTPAPAVKTPDLIFAEFESDGGDHMRKSIRKLLEQERVGAKTTTPQPIYVPDVQHEPSKSEEPLVDYHPSYTAAPAPAPAAPSVWHIIDEEKAHEPPAQWEEYESQPPARDHVSDKEHTKIDENFALPGFATNPGNDAENESRAIRTDSSLKFPYVNLKPFLMKKQRPNAVSGHSKDGGAYTNVDSFYDMKHPVRGEAQEFPAAREPIDRYNPAQPYLPEYGLKVTRQSSPIADSLKKSVSRLVPPPPPRGNSDDFPAPSTYDSFPPYASPFADSPPAAPPAPPPPPPAAPAPPPPPPPPADDTPLDLGYRYKAPSRPFLPTEPPQMSKPFPDYSYEKPADEPQMPPPMPPSMSFEGYSYPKPPMEKPSYGPQYQAPEHDHPPSYGTYQTDYPGYGKPYGMKGGDDTKMSQDSMGMMPPPPPAKPDASKYGPHYGPDAPEEHPPYGHYPSAPSDYPELIYDKPHGMKGGDGTKAADMAPADAKPDDHGFPPDFPDFKYHDFDDDHHDHLHHPTTTTTTTTTETPRVNRYSYYYLGKKLYYLPLYFSVYFIVYVGALIIKAVLRHKIVYPNSWRPNDQTASFFSKRSADWHLSDESLHELTGHVTSAVAAAANKYFTKAKDD